MSRRPHNPAPPGRPGPVRRDRGTPGGQRPPVWPDVVDTVMLAKFTRQNDALPVAPPEPGARPEHPGESTRVLRLPGGKHGSGPMRFSTSSRRRTWVSRAVLFAILCVQAVLSLRMSNTAFEDEALYLYSGHLEIAHLLHGAPLQGDYSSYFSGAPVLYPVLGALADDVGGLAAARAVSLIAMLGTTALLYSLTRRLFNERVGLCAAVIFSVTESALFLGRLATYDAPALFLLALATWIVVRTAPFRWPVYLLAALPIGLAVATKYASALFVPTIVVLAGLAAWPYRGRKALIPPAGAGRGGRRAAQRRALPGRSRLRDRHQVHHDGAGRGDHGHLAAAAGQPGVGRAAVRAGRDRCRGVRSPGPHRAWRADRAARRQALAHHARRRPDRRPRCWRPPTRSISTRLPRCRSTSASGSSSPPRSLESGWPASSATTSAGPRWASRSGARPW